jgi:hypothetical protein
MNDNDAHDRVAGRNSQRSAHPQLECQAEALALQCEQMALVLNTRHREGVGRSLFDSESRCQEGRDALMQGMSETMLRVMGSQGPRISHPKIPEATRRLYRYLYKNYPESQSGSGFAEINSEDLDVKTAFCGRCKKTTWP